ncbi:phage baseplate assembly protein V [Marinobacter sp. OP 3.4]|uniref:phage baseplate assembly protein V n=1 Tax=Marinobacter sp. OP 3.4 TaxID=3076501 RepID=UPI002E24634B
MRQNLARLLAPVWRRLRLLVSRGVVRLSDDGRKLQVVQLDMLAGETAAMERFQQYGFTCRPLDGAEAIALAVGGSRGHLVAIAVDDRRHRMKDMKNGEVALYTDEGDYIHMKRGRIVEVNVGQDLRANVGNQVTVNAGAKIAATAPEVTVDCDTTVVTAATSVTLDTPHTIITQKLTVKGPIIGQGGMAISGGSGASVDGDMQITNGDVKADEISLKHHRTSGVEPGSGTSGDPVV